MNRLKMAVVGVGALGRHHARILSECDQVELVAVADVDPVAAQRVAEACGTRSVENFRELIGQVDAVSIVVPTTRHLAVAAEFLRHNVAVFVEKPLAATVDEAKQLVQLSELHQTPLQVGHIERFNPAFETASQLCGPPKYLRTERVSPYAFRSTDIGAVLDLMIHDIDLVLNLVQSPVRHVDAFGICILGGHEDSVQARLEFENGCRADLSANRVCPQPRRAMQIWSHRGCVNVDFHSRDVVNYAPSDSLLYGLSPLERSREPGANIDQLKQDVFGTFIKVDRPDVPEADALTAELTSFVQAVADGTAPPVTGQQGLNAMHVAERILTCVAAHQWDGTADGAVGPHARQPGRRKLAG